jgi:hypothetical protein
MVSVNCDPIGAAGCLVLAKGQVFGRGSGQRFFPSVRPFGRLEAQGFALLFIHQAEVMAE